MSPFDAVPVLRLATPRIEDYLHVAQHMRPDEIEQFLAVTGDRDYDPDTAARVFLAMPGPSFVIAAGATPVCVGGFVPVRPGVYQAWMAGTPEGWTQHWRGITKHCRRVFDTLLAGDAHRIETIALASRTAAHEWYERGLLQRHEGTHRAYFANGADAVCYARTR